MTMMKGTVREAEKIKKKYRKQKVSQPNNQNKKSTDWLWKAGCLDTENLKTINYDNSNKKNDNVRTENDII